MRRSILVLALVGVLVGVLAAPVSARGNGNLHGQPTIYVTSQDLFYDSIVLTPIPFVEGAPYQLLDLVNLETEFGPGDQEYVGGRWWVDDGNGTIGPEDMFFMCPLLGPGHAPEA